MKEETINKLLLGTKEDVQIAMHWIFKSLDKSRRSGYLKQYYVGNRKGEQTITVYNDRYMINNGWHHLVFSKKGNKHYEAMLTQTYDLIIKVGDIQIK